MPGAKSQVRHELPALLITGYITKITSLEHNLHRALQDGGCGTEW